MGREKNEIKDYFDCRYVSACEAAWRLLAFPLTHKTTHVEKLVFHLPGQEILVFKDNEPVEYVLHRRSGKKTQLLAWFGLNEKDDDAEDKTYAQIPNNYTWKPKTMEFSIRRRGFAVGRINYVPRKITEAYHLRMLLNIVAGMKSFDHIKTVNGVLYKTFKEACFAKGLLQDNKEYIDGILDARFWAYGFYLRKLFVIMLLLDSLDCPARVWEQTWKHLSEDIEKLKRKELNRPALTLSDEDKRNYCLQEIEKGLVWNGSSLYRFDNMPQPPSDGMENSNRLIMDERQYFCDKLIADHDKWLKMLTSEQRKIYDEIVGAVFNNTGGVFFVYGFGGTCKTFLWKVLSAAVRCRELIALNCASSGIALLLLIGGRTAHSRFGIPINPNEFSTCSMKPGSDMAELVKQASLIIWDEAPMMSKHCFESLDRSMKDIVGNSNDKPFGGKVVVFGGDFRQVLPVIPGGTRQDIVFASLCLSYLWKKCKVLQLTKNMRLIANLSPNEAKNIKEFSDWILDICDGNIGGDNDGEAIIDIPKEFLVTDSKAPI